MVAEVVKGQCGAGDGDLFMNCLQDKIEVFLDDFFAILLNSKEMFPRRGVPQVRWVARCNKHLEKLCIYVETELMSPT